MQAISKGTCLPKKKTKNKKTCPRQDHRPLNAWRDPKIDEYTNHKIHAQNMQGCLVVSPCEQKRKKHGGKKNKIKK